MTGHHFPCDHRGPLKQYVAQDSITGIDQERGGCTACLLSSPAPLEGGDADYRPVTAASTLASCRLTT